MSTVLAAVGTSVSLFTATLKLTQQLIELYSEIQALKQTLTYLQLDLRTCETGLDNWMALWAMKGNTRLSESAYKYFWGKDVYQEVQTYLARVSENLQGLRSELKDEIRDRTNAINWTLYRKVKFVVLEKDGLRDRFERLRRALKNLDRVTRSKFWATVEGTATDKSIDNSLPIELATLKEQTERLWITLDQMHEKMPGSWMAASKNGVPDAFWHFLKGTTPTSNIEMGFLRTQGDKAVLSRFRYVPGRDAKEISRECIGEATKRIIQQGESPVGIFLGSNLRDYFGRITEHPSEVQAELRELSHVDRSAVAHEIAQWAVLNWNSAWVDELCICKIYHTFAKDDSTFGSPFRSIKPIGTLERSEKDACMDQACAGRKHLRLAVVLASLALACQVATVADIKAKSLRFVVFIEGSLQLMDERGLVARIRDSAKDHESHWHVAVEECLELSRRGDLGEQMLAADFKRYEARVLEP